MEWTDVDTTTWKEEAGYVLTSEGRRLLEEALGKNLQVPPARQ